MLRSHCPYSSVHSSPPGRALPALLTAVWLLSFCGGGRIEAQAEPAPAAAEPFRASPYRIDDPSAPPVTAENLLASELFWPYRVALHESWQAPGRESPIPANRVGVLIRVEASGNPRIDFGALGKYEVPVEKTDLIERANDVRLGRLDKWGPNFVHAIETRMADPDLEKVDRLNHVSYRVASYQGFLCVFADPEQPGFDALVRELAPLSQRHGHAVMTVFFPLGHHPDSDVLAKLKGLEWRVPFVYGFLAEGYTRSLLDDASEVPSVMLQSPEGRMLFFQRFSPEIVPELAALLDAKFSPPSKVASGSD